MLLEQVWNFHDGVTAWAITGDEWSPMFIDLELTLPRFNRTGEVWLWIMSAVGTEAGLYANNDEHYQFIVRSGSGNDATNLNAGIVDHLCTPNYAHTGAGAGDDRLVAAKRPFFATALPGDALGRYLQLYCDTTGTVGSSNLEVYAGLALTKSAIPNISYLQTMVTNVTKPT